ncbi:6637_t:CDS:2, partial [Racocetra fulgida]
MEKNEDSYHYLWDSVIKNTIETFGMHSISLAQLEFDRNTSKRTSTGKLSNRNLPDMAVLVGNVCPFRGEEKSRNDIGDPSSELVDRIEEDSPEFQTIIRPNGTIIELGYAVKKKFADKDRVTHLKKIYGVLR